MAAAISSSLTVTISSTYFWHISKVRSPGVSTWIPSASVAASFTVVTLPGLAGSIHGGNHTGLHADDLAGGLQLLDGQRHAGDQTAAADGDHDLLHFGKLLQDLQTDGALTGNDIGIVKGMREGVAVLLGKTLGLPGGIIIDTGNQNYLGAIAAGGLPPWRWVRPRACRSRT